MRLLLNRAVVKRVMGMRGCECFLILSKYFVYMRWTLLPWAFAPNILGLLCVFRTCSIA